MALDRDNGGRRTRTGHGGTLCPAAFEDAERDAIERAFATDAELRADAEALLAKLEPDLREVFASAFVSALIGLPRLAAPAGALMPALDQTLAVAMSRRAER